ncbi:hypothetical protein HDU87_000124 [Geranomyces variabilis]|uniref:DNA helicase n=1 Tax=Geranomyces variabilis TaxID=109894 RepID=A0AAD5XV12_9FUNG|nr:hypothetical protein HDU87_000124 [Geranomyces variabilis]
MDDEFDDLFDDFGDDDQSLLEVLAHVESAGAPLRAALQAPPARRGSLNPAVAVAPRVQHQRHQLAAARSAQPLAFEAVPDSQRSSNSSRQTTLLESFGGLTSQRQPPANPSAMAATRAAPSSSKACPFPPGGPSQPHSTPTITPPSPRTLARDLEGAGYVAGLHKIDTEAAKTWIFPTNVSMRDYQFNIISRALFVNTLVALPTGLGKTFIAAVMMFNFFRWFPEGKIVFMAPTKPLVAQQIEACFKITGIPQEATVELTGATAPEARERSWADKRVFFLTPQVMQNDLKSGNCPATKVVMLVIDEAHRATGNHSYCECIRALKQHNERFRVLALTATPGSDLQTVQNVVENTLTNRIEIRTEDSLDIKPYIHHRNIDAITVKLSPEIQEIKVGLIKVAEGFLTRLSSAKALYRTDAANVGKYEILKARERWREGNRRGGGGITPGRAAALEGDFGVAMMLAGAIQLLVVHGIRTCLSTLQHYIAESQQPGVRTSRSRANLAKNPMLTNLIDRILTMTLSPSFTSHPKIDRLVSTIVQHFLEHEDEKARLTALGRGDEIGQTRVMVFSQFRESVDEIRAALEKHDPLVRVMSFVGQAAAGKSNKKGFTQKEQLEVISKFQGGSYNVLVATSIGEEGLDIGEVDLIICFDTQNSPIRMLQRMGRTGRKREGKIVLLLTEGKEEEAHQRSQATYKSVQKTIITQQGKKLQMYPDTLCRMLPPGPKPTCVKEFLEIPEYLQQKRGSRGKAAKPKTPKVTGLKAARKAAAEPKKPGARKNKRKAAEAEAPPAEEVVSDFYTSDEDVMAAHQAAKKRKRIGPIDDIRQAMAVIGEGDSDDNGLGYGSSDSEFDGPQGFMSARMLASKPSQKAKSLKPPAAKKPKTGASANGATLKKSSSSLRAAALAPSSSKADSLDTFGGLRDLMGDDDDLDMELMSAIPFALRGDTRGLSGTDSMEVLSAIKRSSSSVSDLLEPPAKVAKTTVGNFDDEGMTVLEGSMRMPSPLMDGLNDSLDDWEADEPLEIPATNNGMLKREIDEPSEIPATNDANLPPEVQTPPRRDTTPLAKSIKQNSLQGISMQEIPDPDNDEFSSDDDLFADGSLDNIEAIEAGGANMRALDLPLESTTDPPPELQWKIPAPISRSLTLETPGTDNDILVPDTPTAGSRHHHHHTPNSAARKQLRVNFSSSPVPPDDLDNEDEDENDDDDELPASPTRNTGAAAALKTPDARGRNIGGAGATALETADERRIRNIGGAAALEIPDEFAGSQWATQAPHARRRQRIRRAKPIHKHISQSPAARATPHSQSAKKTRRMRVENLIARLAQKKAPRKGPALRGTPNLKQASNKKIERGALVGGDKQKRQQRPHPVDLSKPNPFMDIEAEEASDASGSDSGDDDEEGSFEDWDQDLSGFIVGDGEATPARRTPGSQSVPSTGNTGHGRSPADMQAFYAKSLLSPAVGGLGPRAYGGYKFAWGRSTPGRRRTWMRDSSQREGEAHDDDDDDDESLSGFVVPDDEVTGGESLTADTRSGIAGGGTIHSEPTTPGTLSVAGPNCEDRDPQWEVDTPLVSKQARLRRPQPSALNLDSAPTSPTPSRQPNTLFAPAAAAAAVVVGNHPQLSELEQAALKDCMELDWEDDEWLSAGGTPAKNGAGADAGPNAPRVVPPAGVLKPPLPQQHLSSLSAVPPDLPVPPMPMHTSSQLRPTRKLTKARPK